jgi:TATA-box binding protein (TBP) (component of TFIID and TFIIIB)
LPGTNTLKSDKNEQFHNLDTRSSGKITCTGANSEDQALIAARRFARIIQKLGFNAKFRNYRVPML